LIGHLAYSRKNWGHMGENELVTEIPKIQGIRLQVCYMKEWGCAVIFIQDYCWVI